jgi:phospholipase C
MFQVCIRWIDRTVIKCKMWAISQDKKCTKWADEGSKKCSKWADEGYKKCDKWGKKCKWSTFWNCVIKWFCKAYVWVAKWVCKAWYWVSKWVCKAFMWIARAVCVVFGWIVRTTCWSLDRIRCVMIDTAKTVSGWITGKRKKPKRIEHVFVLMLENRSYDHMLGFANLTGTDAVTGAPTSAEGADPALHSNIDPVDGEVVVPVGTPAPFKIEGTMDEDPGHEFEQVVEQLAGHGVKYVPGSPYPPIDMSGFVAVHRDGGSTDPKSVMLSFTPRQLPVLTTLAREFAVCDRWFSSMPGPTWPNRFFAAAASSGGLDDMPSKLELVVNTALDGYRFENGTIYDLLDGKCLPWKVYHGDELPVTFALAGMTVNRIANRFDDMADFAGDVSDPNYDAVFTFIEPHYGNILPGTPGDYTCGTSQHPLDDVTRGERLIKDVYETIRNSPHWDRSVLIVTWDEHGGFYDHVPPPPAVAPGDIPGDPDNNQNGFDFTQLGPRVPAVVVSPLIERGSIDHSEYDHASIPATVERLFGMKAMTNRDAQATDVQHLLSRTSPRTDAPTTLPNPAPSGWECRSIFDFESRVSGLTVDKEEYEDDRDRVVVFDPYLTQSIESAAHARIRTLKRWDANGRLQVLEDLESIKSELDARQFIYRSREAFRQWSRDRGKTAASGYSRLTRSD